MLRHSVILPALLSTILSCKSTSGARQGSSEVKSNVGPEVVEEEEESLSSLIAKAKKAFQQKLTDVDGLEFNFGIAGEPEDKLLERRLFQMPNFESLKEITPVLEEFVRYSKPIVDKHGIVYKVKVQYGSERLSGQTLVTEAINRDGKVHATILLDELWATPSPALDKDGLMNALCHELGHVVGGYPFVPTSNTGSEKDLYFAVEGEADYFSSHVCLKKIWGSKTDENRRVALTADKETMEFCSAKSRNDDHKNLCARIIRSQFEAHRSSGGQASLLHPDQTIVKNTVKSYPTTQQCRLDTVVAGFFCDAVFDLTSLPKTYTDAMANSCSEGNNPMGARPKCWFKD
jgi:hypothetical protein